MINSSRRLYELDALRGIAALLVVIFHYTSRYEELFIKTEMEFPFRVSYGHYGVQLFFVISGFVIYMSLLRSKSILDFTIKRIIRLYPAYIFAVILTFSVVSLLGLEGREVTNIEAIINLTMLQGYIPGVENVDGVYWSLTIELSFYIIMGFLFISRILNKIEVVSIIWLISAITLNIIDFDGIISIVTDKIILIDYVHLFIAGMMFYHLRESNRLKYHFLILISLLYDFTFNGIESGIVLTLIFSIFYLLIFNKLIFLKSKALVFIGTISYSLYLVHQNIGYIIIRELEKLGYTDGIFIIIPIIMSVILASFITFYIEKPIQKFLKISTKKIIRVEKIPA